MTLNVTDNQLGVLCYIRPIMSHSCEPRQRAASARR